MELSLKKNQHIICDFIFLLYLIGIVFIPINLHITNKIIVLTGIISFVCLILQKKCQFNRNIIYFAAGLFLLGAIDLVWYELYKTNEVIYKNGYRGYLEAGKMFLLSSFTFLFLNKNNFNTNIKFHLVAAILTQALIFLRAYYQGIILNADRIPLSAMSGNIGQMGAATIAAYIITFSALYASIVFLKLNSRYKWLLFYANFGLSFAALVMTGTRAALITYPFITVLMLFIQHREQKVFLAKGISGILVLLLGCGLLFSKEIEKRIEAFKGDIISYTTKNNSVSSIGARFSMIQAGIKSAPQGLEWQSLEQRAINITALSKQDSIYKGATEFLDVHMHNEVVEALSTKGVLGVIFLFFFYSVLIYYCVAEKKYLLLTFPAAIILFGFSDVLMHAKPIPAAWIVCLFLSVLLLGKKEEKK